MSRAQRYLEQIGESPTAVPERLDDLLCDCAPHDDNLSVDLETTRRKVVQRFKGPQRKPLPVEW